jgi:predicted Zn-dependent protease
VRSVQKANEDLTPQQEYYLGRAFGANILATRPPLLNLEANHYLNQLGQALAQFSDRPETWSGYRFLILDSKEVNAFAAPGGFIFVSKGLIQLTRNEAELAAVLAHEIGHVEQEHGLKAIRKDRLTSAAIGIGADAAQTFGSGQMQELSAAFRDSIGDLTKTIVNTGYSRETEYEADAAACRILTRAGYSATAMLSVLELLKNLPNASESGFSRTHPKPEDRIAQVKRVVGKSRAVVVTSEQKRRFQSALGGL